MLICFLSHVYHTWLSSLEKGFLQWLPSPSFSLNLIPRSEYISYKFLLFLAMLWVA